MICPIRSHGIRQGYLQEGYGTYSNDIKVEVHSLLHLVSRTSIILEEILLRLSLYFCTIIVTLQN